MHEGKRHRGSGVVGPLILIGLGAVFLLNNLGVVSWSIWEVLLRVWPVLLIAAGLDLVLGRRSVWGSLLALALTFAVLGAALYVSGTGAASVQAAHREEIAEPLGDVEVAELSIGPGVGRLGIRAAWDSPNLVEGTVDLARQEELTQDVVVRGQRAAFTLRTRSASFAPFAIGRAVGRRWDLRLSPRVPLDLTADLGVGEMDLDLAELTLEGLEAELGIGQTIVVLPARGRFTAQIEGAIGQTIIVIPRSLAAKVRLDTGIADRRMPAGYRCAENLCTSLDYETADDRVDLHVSQAIGSLVIRH